jgi:hypothetical protein
VSIRRALSLGSANWIDAWEGFSLHHFGILHFHEWLHDVFAGDKRVTKVRRADLPSYRFVVKSMISPRSARADTACRRCGSALLNSTS